MSTTAEVSTQSSNDPAKIIANRYYGILYFDVKNGNPNGDPDADNAPRTTPQGKGLCSDVKIKRAIRNYVQLRNGGVSRYEIYVKDGSVLANTQAETRKQAGLEVFEPSDFEIPEDLVSEIESLPTSDGGMVVNGNILRIENEDQSSVEEWAKEFTGESSKKLKDFLKKSIGIAYKEKKGKSDKKKSVDSGRKAMCDRFFDVRAFGAVMSSAPDCGKVTGPVQITFAESVHPIQPQMHSLTRMAIAKEDERNKTNHTFGRKWTVPYGLYKAEIFISPNLASSTGFTEGDLKVLWDAIYNMFEDDHSAARGSMSVRKLVVFKHDSPYGNAPSHKLAALVKEGCKVETPSSYSDYEISVAVDQVPSGVTVTVIE